MNFFRRMTDSTDNDCCICLERLVGTNNFTGSCKHTIHHDCFLKLQNKKCPMCRKEWTIVRVIPRVVNPDYYDHYDHGLKGIAQKICSRVGEIIYRNWIV